MQDKTFRCPAYACKFTGKEGDICPIHKVKVVYTLNEYHRYWIKHGHFRKVKEKPLRLEDL